MRNVGDIVKKKGIIRSYPDETLSQSLSQLSSTHDVSFIFDDEDKFYGVINPYYCVIKRTYPSRAKAVRCRIHPPKLKPTNTLERAAKMMIESKLHCLPVFDDKKFLGIVTARRIMRELIRAGRLSSTTAGDFIKGKNPAVTVYEDDTIQKALLMFKTSRVSKLVVINHSFRLRGVLAYYDIVDVLAETTQRIPFGLRVGDKNPVLQKKVKNYYKTKLLTILPHEPIEKAAHLVLDEVIGSVVVVDASHRPLGIITTKDILRTLLPKKQPFTISLIPINLAPQRKQLAAQFTKTIGSWFSQKQQADRAVIKIEEKKRGGIFEIALQLVRKGQPIKVISKQGKNFSVVIAKFQKTISSYLSKKK